MANKKNKLTEEEVRHIAKLANLTLTEEEVRKFQKQLSETLKYIDILNEIDTSGVMSTSQVAGLKDVTRGDQIKPPLSSKESLSGAPAFQDGFFKTKGVLDK